MIHDIVLGGGCFWGMEELFRAQPGVIETEVGYAGGKNENPTYENHPGHAEALRIRYDDGKTTLDGVLDYFFRIHDPTTKNRQGNDIGTSYRSVIFYQTPEEQRAAMRAIARAQPNWENEIVTTLEELPAFYSAEAYHQDYLQKNPGGYTCHFERSF
jgi:peptide-methionine (S)-S-oxide reductase